ncbi:unnamed protein product [Closterium sp. Yama58-4]|nr:unnamed protein product [Closterium sp. Yama58-4]
MLLESQGAFLLRRLRSSFFIHPNPLRKAWEKSARAGGKDGEPKHQTALEKNPDEEGEREAKHPGEEDKQGAKRDEKERAEGQDAHSQSGPRKQHEWIYSVGLPSVPSPSSSDLKRLPPALLSLAVAAAAAACAAALLLLHSRFSQTAAIRAGRRVEEEERKRAEGQAGRRAYEAGERAEKRADTQEGTLMEMGVMADDAARDEGLAGGTVEKETEGSVGKVTDRRRVDERAEEGKDGQEVWTDGVRERGGESGGEGVGGEGGGGESSLGERENDAVCVAGEGSDEQCTEGSAEQMEGMEGSERSEPDGQEWLVPAVAGGAESREQVGERQGGGERSGGAEGGGESGVWRVEGRDADGGSGDAKERGGDDGDEKEDDGKGEGRDKRDLPEDLEEEERLKLLQAQAISDWSNQIVLQGFNWESHGQPQGWWQHLASLAPAIAAAGFTAVWLPPASSSLAPQGYLPKDLYHLASAYGSEADLRALIAAFRDAQPHTAAPPAAAADPSTAANFAAVAPSGSASVAAAAASPATAATGAAAATDIKPGSGLDQAAECVPGTTTDGTNTCCADTNGAATGGAGNAGGVTAVGVRVIADVVVNHRVGSQQGEGGQWTRFDGTSMPWDETAVTCDTGGKGNPSSGSVFEGVSNIDHSQQFVRRDLTAWLTWLQTDVGFSGFRFDYAKGYSPAYVWGYVQGARLRLCVGEYWDTCNYVGPQYDLDYDQVVMSLSSLCLNPSPSCHLHPARVQPDSHRGRIVEWIEGAGRLAAAFDFTTKAILQEAVKRKEWWRLKDKEGRPPGVMGLLPSHAVTFVDNHDTGSTQAHWPFPSHAVIQGYAYILTHPGIPSVFYDHFFDWGSDLKNQIQQLIDARRRAGIHSRSSIQILAADDSRYAAIIGGNLCVKIGDGEWSPDTSGVVDSCDVVDDGRVARDKTSGSLLRKWNLTSCGEGYAPSLMASEIRTIRVSIRCTPVTRRYIGMACSVFLLALLASGTPPVGAFEHPTGDSYTFSDFHLQRGASNGYHLQELRLGVNSVEVSEPVAAGDGAASVCIARTRLPARPRLRGVSRGFHVLRVTATIPAAGMPRGAFSSGPKFEFCVHWNASQPLGECPRGAWRAADRKGRWVVLRSPFEGAFIDVKREGGVTGDHDVSIKVDEDLEPHRAVFFVLGFLLMLLAGHLSSMVAFYYGGGMTLGVLLVVIVILYQVMRLLPLGRKSSLQILLYGSLMGFIGVIITYVTGAVKTVMEPLGLGDDVISPVVVFVLVLVVLIGAALGFWVVRKFILSPSGELDPPTVSFVKWGLRIIAATLLIMSSADAIIATSLLFLSLSTTLLLHLLSPRALALLSPTSTPSGTPATSFLARACARKSEQAAEQEGEMGGMGGVFSPPQQYGTPPQGPMQGVGGGQGYVTPSRGVEGSPYARMGTPFQGPPGTPRTPLPSSPLARTVCPSSFHRTPHRRHLTPAQAAAISHECTHAALQELAYSPGFGQWVLHNFDRIAITPRILREERSEGEIAATAEMEEGFEEEEG